MKILKMKRQPRIGKRELKAWKKKISELPMVDTLTVVRAGFFMRKQTNLGS